MAYDMPLGLRDREYDKFFSWDSGSQSSVLVTIASGINLTIGSVSASVDSIYIQSGANITGSAYCYQNTSPWVVLGSQHVTQSTSPWISLGSMQTTGSANCVQVTSPWAISGNVLISGTIVSVPSITDNTAFTANGSKVRIVGGFYESTPTAISGNFAGALGMTAYRELKIGGYNTSTDAVQVEDISPALTQSINVTLLNAVGSNAGSHVSSWVNTSNYGAKTIYSVYSSGTTGGFVVNYEVSPDASTAFTAGSLVYTNANVSEYKTLNEHHEYLRMRTTVNSGGTLTTYLIGRGGL